MKTMHEAIRLAMLRLGDSPELIAERLQRAGVRGKRGSTFSCPVAQYLHDQVPGSRAEVLNDTVTYYCGAIDAPRAIQNFVIAFDEGQFPELES